jgi:hypothetical protein
MPWASPCRMGACSTLPALTRSPQAWSTLLLLEPSS